MLSNIFFNENTVTDEIIQNDTAQPDGTHTTIYYTACTQYARLTKVKEIDSEYVTFSAFLQQQWLRERALMLPYTYTVLLSPLT